MNRPRLIITTLIVLAAACFAQTPAEWAEVLRRLSAVEAAVRPTTAPTADFDIEYAGNFSVRVRAKVAGDPKAWRFDWDFGAGEHAPGWFSGWAYTDSTPKTITLTATTPTGVALNPISKPYIPPQTLRTLITLKSGEKFPSTVGSNTDINGAGQTFDVTAKAPEINGTNVAIRNLTLVCKDRAVLLNKGGDILFDHVTFDGAELLSMIRVDGVTFLNCTIRNGGNFLKQDAAANFITIIGCKISGLTAYAAYVDGTGWLIANNAIDIEGKESIIRSSSTRTKDLCVFGNTLTGRTAKGGGIDIRQCDGGVFVGNTVAVCSYNWGRNGPGVPVRNILIEGNKGTPIQLQAGLVDVVARGNEGELTLNKQTGAMIDDVRIEHKGLVTVYSSIAPAAFRNISIDLSGSGRLEQNVGGRRAIDPKAFDVVKVPQ
jgi:hypothetical protein